MINISKIIKIGFLTKVFPFSLFWYSVVVASFEAAKSVFIADFAVTFFIAGKRGFEILKFWFFFTFYFWQKATNLLKDQSTRFNFLLKFFIFLKTDFIEDRIENVFAEKKSKFKILITEM